MDGHFSGETCQAFFLQKKKREEKVKVKNKWYAAKVLELGQHTIAEKLYK